jgi:hypothetical protein
VSTLTNDTLAPESKDLVGTLPFAGYSEAMRMSTRLAALRDTILVVGVQIVFRATLFLRRWNY